MQRHEKNPCAAMAKSDAQCFICQGAFSSLQSLADSAISVAEGQKFEYSSFFVQSSIPRAILVREENLFDEYIKGEMSAKNQINRVAAEYIHAKTGKQYVQQNAQMVFSLDFTRGKASATPASLFIYANYRKLSRQYCQHLWACKSCRGRGCQKCNNKGENYPSVEGAIKSVFAPAFGASDAHLHASGREDVDVIMEGNGRPCVIEIAHPRIRTADLQQIASKLAAAHPIELANPRFCPASFVESVCTSHFEKEYRVWVEAEREVGADELSSLAASAPVMLAQRTPNRVSARRADLVRKRRVISIRMVEHAGKTFTLDLLTDAGTYIKEFVHGDEGRTVPSLSSIFKSPCVCKQLNVIHIHDEFVSTLGGTG